MAALTQAMTWYNLGGLKTVRTKYHYQIAFYSSQYVDKLQTPARLIFDSVRTVELPKYSIDTEIANSWNVRQPIPTKMNFEPISMSFNDTLDNRFQKFIKAYMNIISGNFAQQKTSLRKGFDDFGLKLLDTTKDCPLDKIEIIRFYNSNQDLTELENKSTVTLWRPKIVDVQHDTLDYSASDAVTWQISVRYESVTYDEDTEQISPASNPTTTFSDVL
jgi:hypothetical protein